MRSPSKKELAIGGAVVLVGVGAVIAVNAETLGLTSSTETTTVAAPAPVEHPKMADPLPPLAPGSYLFDVLGSGTLPVSVEATGPESITLVRPANETNLEEFRVTLNRQGDTYVGEIDNPAGVVCKSDKQSHPAQTKYTMRADGSDGLVEVLGEPCGPGDPNIPLKFDLVLNQAPV